MAKNYLKNIEENTSKILKVLTNQILDNVQQISKPVKLVKKNERFIDNGDGTILDMETSLMWQKEGSKKEMNFMDAEKYCNESNIGGHKDWRLPTIKELISIIDYEKYNPAIDSVFKCDSSWYWSGTVCANDSDYAWVVSFSYGSVSWDSRSCNNYVRAVRQYKN